MMLDRRQFVAACAAATTVGGPVGRRQPPPAPSGSAVVRWRDEFPALAQRVNGRPLVYLDSAATTLRPRAVIDAVQAFYETDNANVHILHQGL